jgi:hypothetical protein
MQEDCGRSWTLALQLRFLGISDSVSHHDSEIMDGGWFD